MATLNTPKTSTSVVAQAFPSNSPTGNWRHPRFDEINKRLEATTFGERNVKRILWRLATLVLLFFAYKLNDFLRWQCVITIPTC